MRNFYNATVTHYGEVTVKKATISRLQKVTKNGQIPRNQFAIKGCAELVRVLVEEQDGTEHDVNGDKKVRRNTSHYVKYMSVYETIVFNPFSTETGFYHEFGVSLDDCIDFRKVYRQSLC